MSRHGAHNKRLVQLRLTEKELQEIDGWAEAFGLPRNATVVKAFELLAVRAVLIDGNKKTKAS